MIAFLLTSYRVYSSIKYRRQTYSKLRKLRRDLHTLKEKAIKSKNPTKRDILNSISTLENELTFYTKKGSYKNEYTNLEALETSLETLKQNIESPSSSVLLEHITKEYINREKGSLEDALRNTHVGDEYLEQRLISSLDPQYLKDKTRVKFLEIAYKVENLPVAYFPTTRKLAYRPKKKTKSKRDKQITKLYGGLKVEVEYKEKLSEEDLLPHGKDYTVRFLVCESCPKNVKRKITHSKLPGQSIILVTDKVYFNKNDLVARVYYKLAIASKPTITLDDILKEVDYVDRESLLEARMRESLSKVNYVRTKALEV